MGSGYRVIRGFPFPVGRVWRGAVIHLEKILGLLPLEMLHSDPFFVLTRNTFYGTRYLSHCYARFAFNPLFINWVTI